MKRSVVKSVVLWASLLLGVFLVWHFVREWRRETSLPFSGFLDQAEAGSVRDVTITGGEIKGQLRNGVRFRTHMPQGYDKVFEILRTKKVAITVREQSSGWGHALASWAPFFLLIAFFLFFMADGGGFHTDEITQLLSARHEDIAWSTITPDVNSEEVRFARDE